MDMYRGKSRTGNTPEVDRQYLSYMLRLFRTQRDETLVWRASLEEPITQEVVRFDTLTSLLDFLLAQIGQTGQGDRGEGDKPIAGRINQGHAEAGENSEGEKDVIFTP